MIHCRVVIATFNLQISRCHFADYIKKYTWVRATHAARLFFLIQPIKSLSSDDNVVVDNALTRYYHHQHDYNIESNSSEEWLEGNAKTTGVSKQCQSTKPLPSVKKGWWIKTKILKALTNENSTRGTFFRILKSVVCERRRERRPRYGPEGQPPFSERWPIKCVAYAGTEAIHRLKPRFVSICILALENGLFSILE